MAFSFVAAFNTTADLLGNPLAWYVMKFGNWTSVWTSVAIAGVGFSLSFFIPNIDNDAKTSSPQPEDADSPAILSLAGIRARASAAKRKVQHIIRTQFVEQRTLGLILASLVFTTMGKTFTTVLAQYVSRRLKWTWRDTSLLGSLQSGITLATTSLIVPFFDHLLRNRWSWTLFSKDMILAKSSLIFMVIGYSGIGLAATSGLLITFVAVASLSKGHEYIMRSLLAQSAGEANVAVVFTTMSVLESCGSIVSGPLLAASFRFGLRQGEFWIGFPFFMAALLVFTGLCLVSAASRTAKRDLHA